VEYFMFAVMSLEGGENLIPTAENSNDADDDRAA